MVFLFICNNTLLSDFLPIVIFQIVGDHIIVSSLRFPKRKKLIKVVTSVSVDLVVSQRNSPQRKLVETIYHLLCACVKCRVLYFYKEN